VDTCDFVAGAGPMSLQRGATNAAVVQGLVSEALLVDNEPVSVALSMPNDSNPSGGGDGAVIRESSCPALGGGQRRRLLPSRPTTPTPIRTEVHQGEAAVIPFG
jgi:hypothetical protein